MSDTPYSIVCSFCHNVLGCYRSLEGVRDSGCDDCGCIDMRKHLERRKSESLVSSLRQILSGMKIEKTMEICEKFKNKLDQDIEDME